MIETINNGIIEISVKNKGAELVCFKSLEDDKEYLWEGDPKYWGKHSPILFPFIGFSKDNEYIYDGKIYSMIKHGFARDMDFSLLEKSGNTLKYLLKDTDETLSIYPFKFSLIVEYVLIDRTLEVRYSVINEGDKKMFFSIGGHPAFSCNISHGNAFLQFEKKETLVTSKINFENGLIKNTTEMIGDGVNELKLHDGLFKEDALIFKELNSSYVILNDTSNEKRLKFHFDGFPYLAFWRPEAPFLCIEPWYGIADYEDTNKKIEEKIGVQSINASERFDCKFTVEIL